MIDRKPPFIVRCRGAADVIDSIEFAREHRFPVAIRGGGHNVAGTAISDDSIVIDLSLMRAVHVDHEARIAHVQGGATWGDVDRETQVFGLAAPGGVVSTTGVGGLTLHGGIGHLRRKYGLSIDNLRSAEIVTADGQIRRVSEREHPDLFWAIRGAGSNFGVVTSLEFQLHPVGPTVALAAPLYPAEDAREILPKWREFMSTAPEEISSVALLWSVPIGFPEDYVGRPVLVLAGVYAGAPDEGEEAMRPLREMGTPVLDLSAQEPYTTLQASFDPFFPFGLRYYWKSVNIGELSDMVIDRLADLVFERASPRTSLDIWHHGGAMHRVGTDDTAFGGRDAAYMIGLSSTWTRPEDDEMNISWTRQVWSDLQEFSTGSLYLNFPGLGEEKEDLVRAGYGSNYERLRALKAEYDPDNMFRSNQNIIPASREASGD